jgi:hypothetical protein
MEHASIGLVQKLYKNTIDLLSVLCENMIEKQEGIIST